MKTTVLMRVTAVAVMFALTGHAANGSRNAAKMFGSAIADVVEETMPSVVVVRTESYQYHVARDMFFGDYYTVPERLAGHGSGVIISKDGYLITNNHVVDGAEHVEIVLTDGTKFPADVVGVDPHTDIAVLKIRGDGRDFDPIPIGDSDKLRVGEFVVAMGSPYSLSSSVTLGIVSQKGRSIGLLPFEDFIQTDAAVNKGNSGGPLVDMDGNLVGINTVIQTTGRSEGNIGISFSIPANLAMNVVDSIKRTGRWERPWIGIRMRETERGVEVIEVVGNGPAAKGGIRRGDVLMAIDDNPVRAPHEVQRSIFLRAIGDPALVKVRRGDKMVNVELITETMPTPQWILQN